MYELNRYRFILKVIVYGSYVYQSIHRTTLNPGLPFIIFPNASMGFSGKLDTDDRTLRFSARDLFESGFVVH